MKKFLAGITTLLVFGISSTTFAATFLDLQQDHWAYDKVETLVDAGIIAKNDQFNGDQIATKYETATMLHQFLARENLLKSNSRTDFFSDVPQNHWAYKFVTTLANEGIIPTNQSQFNGANQTTRYELALMLYNALADKSAHVNAKFTDVSSDNPYFNAAQWAGDSGVMDGFGDGSFRGNNTLTRYELAQIIGNLYEAF